MRDDDIEWLKFVQNAEGAILGPFDSWLVLRGTKTLPLRMQQHNANGLALARVPRRAPEGAAASTIRACRRTRSTTLAKRQMRGFGGMLAFELGSLEAARRLLNAVRLHALAESLGGVETLISHPATMTHAVGAGRAARGNRHHRRHGAHLGRRRGHRRSQRGPAQALDRVSVVRPDDPDSATRDPNDQRS